MVIVSSEVELGLMECNRADILSFVKGISSNNHPRFSGEGGRGDATGYHWPLSLTPHGPAIMRIYNQANHNERHACDLSLVAFFPKASELCH